MLYRPARRDLDDWEGLLLLFVAPDGDGEFAALDELLDEDFVVVHERRFAPHHPGACVRRKDEGNPGSQLTENGLRQSIARYNARRGVQKTSIHLFRHTFARKYLIDCGGDAFTLQKLLGHSTLAMTKHYCAIYDADLTKNYDNFSPLAQMKAGGAKIKMPAKGR